jgi:plasmid stabilization system protein ParE
MPTAYRVILMPEAFDNLDAIVNHIKRDSPQNAASTLDLLWRATQSLNQFPHRYKIHRRTRGAERVVHSMPVPPFLIYYEIIEQPSTVRVLTIRDGARRPPGRFE